MNPLTHKLCRKCNTPYPHYGSSLTKCPRREELKQLKKEDGNLHECISKGLSGKRGGLRKANIKSERAGRKVRKLTSEGMDFPANGRKRIQISKVSKKQAVINDTLTKIKAQMVNDNDSQCFTCHHVGDVDLSHLIPRSKRSDLITDKSNLVLHCRRCHTNWEALNVFEIRKFRNLKLILDYIESVDSSRFIHVTSKLNEQLNASR